MHRIDLILKQLSELYEFNKKLRSFTIRETGEAGSPWTPQVAAGREHSRPHYKNSPQDETTGSAGAQEEER